MSFSILSHSRWSDSQERLFDIRGAHASCVLARTSCRRELVRKRSQRCRRRCSRGLIPDCERGRFGYARKMAPRTLEGTYENGTIRLDGTPPSLEKTRVLVTFLTAGGQVDLAGIGIAPAQAANLRGRLQAFAEDWDRAEMDVYDAL